jgi:N-acyl homoserine lactone hydrolase
MAPLPAPSAWLDPLPAATAPAGVTIYQLPTGTYETRAALAVQGGSFRDKRQFAATAVLVSHPQGDLLIDAGFGSQVAEHIAMLPRLVRAPYQVSRTADEQLDTSGYDRSRLLGAVVTHSHWDHVSGLNDLQVPVWINRPELEIREYALDGPAYLGFPSSLDVHSDGSVIIALAGGHTLGSVVVFVTLPTGARYAFIGDLTWQLDGIRRRVERPWLLRKLADSDAGQVRQGLSRMIALAGVMTIVPAHDRDAYAGIPLLPAHFSPAAPAATH